MIVESRLHSFPNRSLFPVAWAGCSLLQNNPKELFGLLNFICPENFVDYAGLDSFLSKDSEADRGEEQERGSVPQQLARDNNNGLMAARMKSQTLLCKQ